MSNSPQPNILPFPRKCIYCGGMVSDGTAVCDPCFEDILPISKRDGDAA
jgi:hypothetical protein